MQTAVAAIRHRWALVGALTLMVMMLGAMWAAAATPSYRSTATIAGGADLLAAATSDAVVSSFATAGATFDARSVGDSMLELSADASSPSEAEDLAQAYVDALMLAAPGTEIIEPANFPISPRSPNLARAAALTLILGLAAGSAMAMLLGSGPPADAGFAEFAATVQQGSLPAQPVSDVSPADFDVPEQQPLHSPEAIKAPRIDPAAAATRSPSPVSDQLRVVELPPRH